MNRSITRGALAVVGVLSGLTAMAESVQWSGGMGSAWSSAANWSGGKVPSVSDTVVLGDGDGPVVGTDTLRQRGGRIDDWSVADDWLLDGITIETGKGFSEHPAFVTNSNVLVLTDDTGGQRNFAFYKRQSIGSNEVFEAEFDYQATLLNRYAGESRAEGFGCYFGDNACHFDWSHCCAIPIGVYGFMVKVWGDGGFAWIYDQERPNDATISGTEMGLDFYQPVHMKVRFDHGLLTVRMTQGTSVWSATRDISAGFANGTRRSFGFSGGTTANSLYYAYQTISNFIGRSSFMGGVCREGYLPYSTDTWQLNDLVASSMEIENEASLLMKNVTGACGTAFLKKKISTREAFTFEFTERLSDIAGCGEGMAVSVNPETTTPGIAGNRFTIGTSKAIGLGHKWWENLFRFYNNETGVAVDSDSNPNGITLAADADYSFYFSHDGCGKFTARVMSPQGAVYATEQNFPEVMNWGDDMYLGLSFGSIWCFSLSCRAKNPRLGFTYDGPTEIAGGIEVVPNATAALSVANLTADAAQAAITVPELVLSEGSVLTVAPSTAKGVRVTADVIRTTGAATLSAGETAVVELNALQVGGLLKVVGKWSAHEGVITLRVPRSVFRTALGQRLMELDPNACADASLPTFALVDENGVPYSSRRRVIYKNGIVSLYAPGLSILIK